MRSGFSRSSGSYIGGGCNTESNGIAQAKDVRAVLDYAKTLPYVDSQRIVVMGQSHGGLTTMAFGTEPYPGVLGLVNFAGGLKDTGCSAWEQGLVSAFGRYGEKNRYPSLWFYGDNDSYWPKETIEKMHAAYVNSGGTARMVAFGIFAGGDAHAMFSREDGLKIWWPEVEKFFTQLGLPTEILPVTEESAPITVRLLEESKKLALNSGCQKLFQSFLEADYPRAFAVGSPRCGYASGQNYAERAVVLCRGKVDANCKIVATNDSFVEGI